MHQKNCLRACQYASHLPTTAEVRRYPPTVICSKHAPYFQEHCISLRHTKTTDIFEGNYLKAHCPTRVFGRTTLLLLRLAEFMCRAQKGMR